MHMLVSQSNIHVGGKCDIYRLPKRRKWFRINFRLSVNTESTFKIYFNFTGASAWLRAYLCPYFSSLAPKWLNRLFTRARYGAVCYGYGYGHGRDYEAPKLPHTPHMDLNPFYLYALSVSVVRRRVPKDSPSHTHTHTHTCTHSRNAARIQITLNF